MVKKEKTKEIKKKDSKVVKAKKATKKEKVNKENFIKSAISELKKSHWPDKKYILKYTIVTLVFIVVLSVFFYLISALMSFVKVWLV